MTTTIEKRNLHQDIEEAFNARGRQSTMHKKYLEAFLAKGLPGSKNEEYKFTPVTRFLERTFKPSELPVGTMGSLELVPGLKCNVIAFVNGIFTPSHSSIIDQELSVKNTEIEAQAEEDPFGLLNGAFADQVDIIVETGKVVKHPIVIVYHFNGPGFVFANPRWRIQAGKNSEISVLEYTTVLNGCTYFNNKHSTISLAENAGLEYTFIQNSETDMLVNNANVRLSPSSRASCYTFTFDGQLVRNNLTISIDGQGVDAYLYGLYLLSKNTIADNHTVVDHRMPNSSSNELYKGVMEGNSKGIFNGKIYVRPDAQKTNAFQSNRNLLLSGSATVNTKPQLEIWADDVKCSHGCTTGQLDEEALFYLRSRGIPKNLAKGMMLSAFATETLTSMRNEVIRNFVSGIIAEKLQHGA
jgi:Fe-S cluster assembly protein SufD